VEGRNIATRRREVTQTDSRLFSPTSPSSLVLEVEPALPDAARRHFAARLCHETDPSDVHHDLEMGDVDIVVADMRDAATFAREHIPGAINLPYRELTEESTAHLRRDAVYVTYCAGPGCNAAVKGAARLAELGFQVKEMIGGIEYWKREGFPTERG
jgi:rhodanese-related sulfurtransferase